MNFHLRYAKAEVVDICLIGVGGFGRSLIAQSDFIPLLTSRVLIDLDAEAVVATLKSLGKPESSYLVCKSPGDARDAWTAGKTVVTDDFAHVVDLPFSVLVEATGHPEAGARHARMGVEAGKHVVLVSKEVDSVIGAGLVRSAQENGVVVTPVDGDQPSLLIGLITWAEVLGLEIISAGKSSEYDFVFDEASGTLTCNGVSVAMPEMAGLMDVGDRSMPELAAQRSKAAAGVNQRAVPDLCEMSIVANSTGMGFDRPDLHAPIARIPEVPAMFETRENGGLFGKAGVLDVFHCLRRPEEVSLAGGVFVVVRCDDADTWKMLEEKGHIVNASGSAAMLAVPRHLLGLEATTTILDAAVLGETNGGACPAQNAELVAYAAADLSAGHVLSMGGHHHTIANVEARILPGGPLDDASPAPFYLAANKALKRAVSAGSFIRLGDLEIGSDSELWALRQTQDQTLFADRFDGAAS